MMRGARATPRLALAAVVLLLACDRREQPGTVARARTPGPRLTMATLPSTGGVPRGWQLTPPAGDVASGRRLFTDFGCHSCHRVAGEPFSVKPTSGVGPDLTGMGAHHPPAYFAESIINPDAILVDEPGYVGPDGHSVMPDYPEMTVAQLADLVAYVSSLRTGDVHAGHVMPADAPADSASADVPGPGALAARAFFAQSYDVKPDQLAAFMQWFRSSGGARFLALDGLLAVDTYVDAGRPRNQYTTVWSFRDDDALRRFNEDPAAEAVGSEFDGFIGDHGHMMRTTPPLYRVPTLSIASDEPAKAYYFTSYDVNPGQLQAYEQWFAREGRRRLSAMKGFVDLVTYVDLTRPRDRCTTIFGFRDTRSAQAFASEDLTAWQFGVDMDAFMGEHHHNLALSPPLRRVAALSAP